MQEEEAALLKHIIEVQAAMAAMSDDAWNRSRLYLTDRELASLACMAHDTVFAVSLDALLFMHLTSCLMPCSLKTLLLS